MDPLASSDINSVLNTLKLLQGGAKAEPGILDIIRSSLFMPQMSFVSMAFLCAIGYLVARMARNKGRSPVVWFWYAFWAAYIAVPHVLLARTSEDGIRAREHNSTCPECGYVIDIDAVECPRCKTDLRARYVRFYHAPSEARPITIIVTTMIIFGLIRYIESYLGIKIL